MDANKKFERFLHKAAEVHKGENLDYSKAEYINGRTPILIIDHDLKDDGTEYGEYWQMPCNHLKGQSHPLKRGKKIQSKKKSEQEDVIRRFKEVHNGEGLDYSKVNYVNMHTKVCIIDPIYGEYWQEPSVHLKGCGSPLRIHKQPSLTTEEFIERARKIHGDYYNYGKVNYTNYRGKVVIICPKHGEFEQTAENHLYGKGCPKCGNHYSKYEDEIIGLLSPLEVIQHERTILGGKEIDLYFPSHNIGIEFNGLRWHTEWFAGKGKNYHLDKTISCNKKGIKLIQIFEDEWILHKDIIISKLRHIFNLDNNLPHIYARKTTVKEIDKGTAKEFLNDNHIQGFVGASIYLGAFYNEKLISVMSFKKCENNEWDLNRFASDINYVCCGVGGKLFKYFIKKYNPSKIKSFADRRWTMDKDNNVYISLGFSFDGYLLPDYRYYNPEINRVERCHKFGFRKQILHKKYGLPLTMTETEMVKEIGYDRIWDCGLIKYMWEKEKEAS